MEVLQLPASTGKLLIPSDFNNAWELRRSLANSQNISLPTLNWILYLPSNFFFFAGKPSPGSLPWSMFFSALTRWVASRKHRKDGEWILSLFPVYMVGWSQSYCKTSPVSFCTKSEFGYTQSRAREVRATEKELLRLFLPVWLATASHQGKGISRQHGLTAFINPLLIVQVTALTFSSSILGYVHKP